MTWSQRHPFARFVVHCVWRWTGGWFEDAWEWHRRRKGAR